jgi:protein-S-isoprenylcysteine O-methyltransferase Ste14
VNIVQSIAIVIPWALWLIYWIATSKRVKQTAQRETSNSRTLQSIPLIAGGALILVPDLTASAWVPGWQHLQAAQFAGLAVLLAGLAFSVSLKEGHELVRSGPYRLVRHPIYTGCLIALAGAVLIGEQWRCVAGLLLIFASLAYKVRVEESWLTRYFGPAYTQYRREVAALIPGLY